jgi:hypothetical protein
MSEIKQFKLTNDDEIICEVVEWDNEDTSNIVVRRALKLINVEDFSKGIRFFAFRPWMLFNDDPDEFQSINAVHIIGEINPSDDVVKRYKTSVLAMAAQNNNKKSFSLDEVAEKADWMNDEEFDNYMESLTTANEELTKKLPDSDENINVIKFKPKKPILH